MCIYITTCAFIHFTGKRDLLQFFITNGGKGEDGNWEFLSLPFLLHVLVQQRIHLQESNHHRSHGLTIFFSARSEASFESI